MAELNISELAKQASETTVDFIRENLTLKDKDEEAEAVVGCLVLTVSLLVVYLRMFLPDPHRHSVMAMIDRFQEVLFKELQKECQNGRPE